MTVILTGSMARHEAKVDIPGLVRAASFVPSTVNEEARTVELVWTTGARVLRGFFDRYWEELSLDPKAVRMKRLNNGAPLLDSHRDDGIDSIIGVVEEAWLEKGRGVARVRFDSGAAGMEAFRKVREGILQNISVGYSTYRMEKIEDGADKLPVFRAIDWEPYELSALPMGADDGAGFRSKSKTTHPCVFVTPRTATPNRPTRAKEQHMADDDDETSTTNPAPDESPAVAATRAASQARAQDAKERADERKAAAEQAIAAERERIAGIRSLARRTKLGDAWATNLIENGVSVEDARRAALDAVVDEPDDIDKSTGLRIGAGEDARDKFVRGASAWLLERTGKHRLIEQAKKRSPELFAGLTFDGGNEFRGLSPIELARESLERQGVRTRGMDRMRMLGLAFTHRSGGMQTTSDFAVLLENVLHKVLLGAYAVQETTWQRFCGTDDVPDFRTSNRYMTGSLPSLPRVAEHAEYTNGQIPDAAKYGISTERHGEIFSLSREAIINDDMGALANLAGEFGRAAARTIENDVFALLAQNAGLGPTMADGQPFFHANRVNVGVGSALTVAGLDADRVVMRAQKDPSGKDYLSLSPSVLLVPDSLRGTAQVINDAQYDPDTANKLQRPNMVRGLFGDIVGTPRLAAASTRRYLFVDPATQSAAIVVAFLEGYGRGPIMESRDGWRIDGVEWKVTQYAKAQTGDFRAAVTNAGA